MQFCLKLYCFESRQVKAHILCQSIGIYLFQYKHIEILGIGISPASIISSRYHEKVIESSMVISCLLIGPIWERCAFTRTTMKSQFFLANCLPEKETTPTNFVFTMFPVASLELPTPQPNSACLPPQKVRKRHM